MIACSTAMARPSAQMVPKIVGSSGARAEATAVHTRRDRERKESVPLLLLAMLLHSNAVKFLLMLLPARLEGYFTALGAPTTQLQRP